MLNVNKNMLPIYTSPQKAGLDVRIQKRWLSPSLQNVQEVIYHEVIYHEVYLSLKPSLKTFASAILKCQVNSDIPLRHIML